MEHGGGAESSAQPLPAPPSVAEELFQKLQELEASHAHLKQGISMGRSSGLADAAFNKGRHFSPFQSEGRCRDEHNGAVGGGGGVGSPSAMRYTERQYMNILQSMGQAVHMFDLNGRLIYWNRAAADLYGYSAAEALGQDVIELLTETQAFGVAGDIVYRVKKGESWTGQFPVKNKRGDRFVVFLTNNPFYDDIGTLVGIMCVSVDSKPFQEIEEGFSGPMHMEADSSFSRPNYADHFQIDPPRPLQVGITSRISNLVSKVRNKVKSKMRAGANMAGCEGGSGGSHQSDHSFSDAALSDLRQDVTSNEATKHRDIHHFLGVFSHASHGKPSTGKPSRKFVYECEGKLESSKIITSKAEKWVGMNRIRWPWKANELEESKVKTGCLLWPWLCNDQESELSQRSKSFDSSRREDREGEIIRNPNNEAPGSWSPSFTVNSTSTSSSCGSSAVIKVGVDTECLDYEILWKDLRIGRQIGRGSCGVVYHAMWYGSVHLLLFPLRPVRVLIC